MSPTTQTLYYPSFRRWVGRQTGTYQTSDQTQCPMALWAMDKFHWPSALAGISRISYGDDLAQIVPTNDYNLVQCLMSTPRTYEALTKRLDARYTKTGLRRRRTRSLKPDPYPTVLTGSFKRGATT